MTNIILIVIGITLAAGTALMTVYYGGDAVTGGVIRAKALQLRNAGLDVKAAALAYRITFGRQPASPSDLVTAHYLTQLPETAAIGRTMPEWQSGEPDGHGEMRLFYMIRGIPLDVCRRINMDIGLGPAMPEGPSGAAGCFQTRLTAECHFYASI